MTTMTTPVNDTQARMGLAALGGRAAWLHEPVAERSAADVWAGLQQDHAEPLARRARELDLEQIARATEKANSRFVTPADDEWPVALDELGDDAPLGLWIAGEDLRAAVQPVTLVGARACTTYGEHVAVTLAADLAMAGHTSVTGGSFGVDAAATRGALGVGGHAVIIAASGIDEPYPAAHSRLWDRTTETGSIVTEHAPGTKPSRYAFLARARLLAALARATVVVEAAMRSGAAETASWARRLSRPVLAVPGPVTSAVSSLPHRLIREGDAQLVASAEDIIESLNDQEN